MPPRTRRSLELIPNESARKMTFRKRKKSVYKKADELSTLCGIDVCLVVYEADHRKGRAVDQPETWPEDRSEFNRILNKYKASKDIPSAGLKRNFDLSDFYEAKKKDAVHSMPHKLHKQISEEACPTWDSRLDQYSQDELRKLIGSLEGKIQASSRKIDSMERSNRFVDKQNHNVLQEKFSRNKAPHHMYSKPANSDELQTSDELGAFKVNSRNSTNSYPMLPSAWISNSESQKMDSTSTGSNPW